MRINFWLSTRLILECFLTLLDRNSLTVFQNIQLSVTTLKTTIKVIFLFSRKTNNAVMLFFINFPTSITFCIENSQT